MYLYTSSDWSSDVCSSDLIRFISDARLLVFGTVLVVVMNFRPDGLLPRKKREKAIVKKGVDA
jgi:branched-chain amino acid transport system permease protein